MKKLEKLTLEQESHIPVLRKEWEDLFYKNQSLDRENAEKYIGWLYKKYLGKEEPPTVMVMKSPLGCQLLIHILKKYNIGAKNLGENLRVNLLENLWVNLLVNLGDNLRDNLRDNLEENLWVNLEDNLLVNLGDNLKNNLWNNLWVNLEDNLKENLWVNLEDNLMENIRVNLEANLLENLWVNLLENLRDNLENNLDDNLWANLRETYEPSERYYTGIGAYGFAASYDFLQYTGHFKGFDFSDFNNYKKLLQTGIYELYVFDGLCIVCEMPKVVQNERKQLHNVNGPAVVWRDGWEQYLVNGMHITNELYKKTVEEKLTVAEFFNEENEETKSAIIALMQERFGEEYVFRFFSKNLVEVDSYVDKKDEKYLEGTTKGMNVGVYTLFKGEINNEDVAYVRCYCPSTDRMFFLGVDPKHGNAKDAIASLYRVPKKLKNNIKYIQRQGERFSTVFDEKGTKMLKNKEVDCNDTVTISGDDYFNLMTYEY